MPCSVTLIKKMSYRGNPNEEWSNKYFLTGGVPASDAEWLALVNALKAQERTCYSLNMTIVRAYGYNSDELNADSVYQRDMVAATETVVGTLSSTGGQLTQAESAAWVRWKTSRMSRGKPIYLRKYFHGIYAASSTTDTLSPATVTALQAFGAKMRDGTFLDGRTVRARNQTGETFLGHSISTYLTTRELKRRGKRPPTGS